MEWRYNLKTDTSYVATGKMLNMNKNGNKNVTEDTGSSGNSSNLYSAETPDVLKLSVVQANSGDGIIIGQINTTSCLGGVSSGVDG
jgi:hypothetical protein